MMVLIFYFNSSIGAFNAITRKEKGSLFAVGIKKVEGVFNAQQCVDIVCINNPSSKEDTAIEPTPSKSIGRGIVNYSSSEIQRILGVKSKEIANILGYIETEFVINRDNLAIRLP